MKPKKVIRIEYPTTGRGLFTGDIDGKTPSVYNFAPEISDRHRSFPNMINDFIELFIVEGNLSEYFCAYLSIDQLQEWVTPDELRVVIKEGFVILLLEVTHYHESKYQVIYTKESITQTMDITSLFIKQLDEK